MAFSASPSIYRASIERSFSKLALPVPSEGVLERLTNYVVMTEEWGKKMDLTAARTADELVDLSIADAAVIAHEEARRFVVGDRVVDVGTGGGAPGIPLLVLLGGTFGFDLPAALVEPRQKRVAFLRQAVLKVGLTRTEVRRARSEEQASNGFEVAIARATLPPPEWLAEGGRLATKGVWVLLAREAPPEIPGFSIDVDTTYEWPLTKARRRAVRYRVPTS